MTLFLLHLILHKELLGVVRPSWHYTSQHNSESFLLPSHTVLPAADASAMGRNTPASLWHSGWRAVEKRTRLPQGRISTMDEKRSSRHMKEKLGPGTRQPWKALNAKWPAKAHILPHCMASHCPCRHYPGAQHSPRLESMVSAPQCHLPGAGYWLSIAETACTAPAKPA